MSSLEEAKLEQFLKWLQLNNVQLRGCCIKHCGPNKGFGIFSSNHDTSSDGVLLVVPLDLAITPMRVLDYPLIGPECRAMYGEGEVDDRFLVILYLMFERLRRNSSWKPYLDMLPTNFGTPLWFSDDELLELKGTSLYRATQLQKKDLSSLYEEKVKSFVKKLLVLDGDSESEVRFEDFLWANSIFWTRAMSIPVSRSYVFPGVQGDSGSHSSVDNEVSHPDISNGDVINEKDEKRFKSHKNDEQVNRAISTTSQAGCILVEGLVPGIDFCNHDCKAVATWEVDGTDLVTGVPHSMYLRSAEQTPSQIGKEITISYSNKGNEELLYLYGFVLDNNPDDYLMVHYPVEAIHKASCSDCKMQLIEEQKAETRCLLPRNLLKNGFFPAVTTPNNVHSGKPKAGQSCNFSWSGQRMAPSYTNKLVFPEEFLTALRTIAMHEDEIWKVQSLLEELVGTEGERIPTEDEVKAAVWEASGNSGALQILVDLLNTKLMNLEEGSGTEESDSELLKRDLEYHSLQTSDRTQVELLSRNRRSSIVYRRGQKELTRLFLKEAEHALQLSLDEGN